MADYVSSENQPYGGVILTIDSVKYRAINWGPAKGTREVSRNDTQGNIADFRLEPEPVSGTVTVQLATTSTAIPDTGDTFTVGSTTYVITSVTKNEPEGDFHSCDIGYRQSTGPGSNTELT